MKREPVAGPTIITINTAAPMPESQKPAEESVVTKCPECGGNKIVTLSNGKHRCQYCGSTF